MSNFSPVGPTGPESTSYTGEDERWIDINPIHDAKAAHAIDAEEKGIPAAELLTSSNLYEREIGKKMLEEE